MPEQPSKFYVTTPIYYVNARPHIGHAYTTVVADVLARRHRLLGDDTFFLTGTDEHGQKIERSAAAAGIPPQQFADGVSAQFKALWDRMGLTYNSYIRTTDPCHKQGVQQLFRTLYDRGFIYLSTYTGSYCVSDEAFVDQPAGTPCPDCGRLLETVTEENFFFELSAFQRPLLDLIESNQLTITPDPARNEVLSFLRGNIASVSAPHLSSPRDNTSSEPSSRPEAHSAEVERPASAPAQAPSEQPQTAAGTRYQPGALKDLSVSRSSFTWGIPVPDDIQERAGATQKHVVYVWLDALANYITAIGYGSDSPEEQKKFSKYWPADLHLVGKEITRFHCVYWPAFLLALNPQLQHNPKEAPPVLSPADHANWAQAWVPKQITANGWLLFDNAKMSKSRGNVVRTETILDAFGDHVYGKQFPDSTKPERDLFAADVLRYYLLREIPFGQDGSFTFDALVTRYNADLANGYGNLVSRTLKLLHNDNDGSFTRVSDSFIVPATYNGDDLLAFGSEGLRDLAEVTGTVISEKPAYDRSAADQIVLFRHAVDDYLTANAPWKLDSGSSAENSKRQEILHTAAESIRIITALLYPILPFATAKVWAQLGLGDIEAAARNGELNNLQWGGLQPGTRLGPLAPIFPRADKGLAQLMTDMEDARTPAAALAASDPAAPPRTSSLDEPAGTLTVGGSNAATTNLPTTPGPHTEAPASGVFAAAPAAPAAPEPSFITIDDFMKVELRVAQILVAERIPKADKLLRLEVDLGPDQIPQKRQILSGIAEWYTPEELLGRRIVIVSNLAPRKMRGLESHGMLLAASQDEDGKPGKPILATFGEDIALGSRVR